MLQFVYKTLQIFCLFSLSIKSLPAQETYRAELLQIWHGHKRVQVYSRGSQIQVQFHNGTKQTLSLDTIFENGFFSNGSYILYNDIKIIYSERTSFFFNAILRPLGPAMMVFSAYIGLNTTGLLISRGIDDPNTQLAAKYTLVSLGSGFIVHRFAESISLKKHRTQKRKITVM